MPACTQETLKYAHASVRTCNYLDSITLRRSRKFMQRQPTSCGVSDVRTNNNAAAHCINFINKEKFPTFSNFACDFSCALHSVCLARYSKTKLKINLVPAIVILATSQEKSKVNILALLLCLSNSLVWSAYLAALQSANIGPLKGVACARLKYSFTNQK